MAKRKGEGARSKNNRDTQKLRRKAVEIVKRLEKVYPNARLELEYDSPFQLLVEAILAAQESDKVVNKIRREFFRKFPTPNSIAKASQEEIEKAIKSINFYRRKAKLLKECCKKLVELFQGEVPKTVEELTKLPGVGRKTANMVIGGGYNLPAIIVDRHVFRVVQRVSLSKQENPEKMEMELREIIPQELWTKFSLLILNLGKQVCKARKPNCSECIISDLCEYGRSLKKSKSPPIEQESEVKK